MLHQTRYGLSPEEAELAFLNEIACLPEYGVLFYKVSRVWKFLFLKLQKLSTTRPFNQKNIHFHNLILSSTLLQSKKNESDFVWLGIRVKGIVVLEVCLYFRTTKKSSMIPCLYKLF